MDQGTTRRGSDTPVYKTVHRIWLRILSIALEKELKVLDFAYGLNYYYYVLFNCFSLLLRFLTSLIELILWLSFPIDKRQAEDMEGIHPFSHRGTVHHPRALSWPQSKTDHLPSMLSLKT